MNPLRTSVILMERRQASRVATNCGATLRFADGAISCFVVNLSAGGAGLTYDRSFKLPPNGFLSIEGDIQPRPCRVVWQDEGRFGVAFE